MAIWEGRFKVPWRKADAVPHGKVRGFHKGRIPRCSVIKFAPYTVSKLIARGNLTFDERVVLHFFSLLLSILELSGTQVYKPSIRALLGSASHFCEVFVLKLRSLPIGKG